MKTKLQQILGYTSEVIQNYYVILILALISAISFITTVDNTSIDIDQKFLISKIGIVSSLGISLFFALHMLSEKIGKKLYLMLFGIIFLIAYFFLLPEKEKDFKVPAGIMVFVSFILSHLLVSFIPYLKKNQEGVFWHYNKNLFINSILTAIFTGVLTGGVLLAITAMDKLFLLDIESRTYLRTYIFMMTFGSCFIFLLFSRKGLFDLEVDSGYPEVLKFFVQFVLIPLLILYAIILYLYGGKILVKWNLPEGWVSLLILAYSLVGILALLLVYPLKENNAKTWVKGFSKIFYFALLPLLVLLFVAIFTRILEYGFTENRYYVLLLAVWLTVIVLYFSLKRDARISFIPISLFTFGLFSLVFPYLNTFSLSKTSQKTELNNFLIHNKLLTNGKIDFNKKVQDSVATEIANKFDFLNQRKEQDFLLTFLPEKSKAEFNKIFKEEKYSIFYHVKDEFKNIERSKNNSYSENEKFKRVFSDEAVFENKNYDYVVFIDNNLSEKITSIDNHLLTFRISHNSSKGTKAMIELKNTKKVSQTYDLIPFLKEKLEKGNPEHQTSIGEISTEFDLHDYHFKVITTSIENSFYNQKENISIGDVLIFIKKKPSSK